MLIVLELRFYPIDAVAHAPSCMDDIHKSRRSTLNHNYTVSLLCCIRNDNAYRRIPSGLSFQDSACHTDIDILWRETRVKSGSLPHF